MERSLMGNDANIDADSIEAARRVRAEWLAVLGIDESTASKMSMVDVPMSVVEEEHFLRLARGMTQER